MLILLVDERPEEVFEMEAAGVGEVIASSFDNPASQHVAVAELTLERARRRVELGEDVVLIVDSLTRLARAYNTVEKGTGRTLSGGLDAQSLERPKRFLGSARKVDPAQGGGSLTIIATALVDTGSKMDQVIFEEFKGTGNSELVLSRELAERRIFPAIDLVASATRREELLLDSGGAGGHASAPAADRGHDADQRDERSAGGPAAPPHQRRAGEQPERRGCGRPAPGGQAVPFRRSPAPRADPRHSAPPPRRTGGQRDGYAQVASRILTVRLSARGAGRDLGGGPPGLCRAGLGTVGAGLPGRGQPPLDLLPRQPAPPHHHPRPLRRVPDVHQRIGLQQDHVGPLAALDRPRLPLASRSSAPRCGCRSPAPGTA